MSADASDAVATLWEEMSVNEVIRAYPATVGVFNEFGIDACCGGSAIVWEAAERDRADPDELRAALERAIRGQG